MFEIRFRIACEKCPSILYCTTLCFCRADVWLCILYGLASNHRIDRKCVEYSRAIIHDENLFAEALFSIFGTHAHIVAIIHSYLVRINLLLLLLLQSIFRVSQPFLLSPVFVIRCCDGNQYVYENFWQYMHPGHPFTVYEFKLHLSKV